MAIKKIIRQNPLGVFDSGIGGLTVASAIHKILPDETLVYFGDTAHLPYGDKSPESIRKWSVAITDFLLTFNCKMLVIACNTISATAFEEVKKHVNNKAIVVNVIDPVAEYVSKRKTLKHVGVIGTKATIKTNAYAERIRHLNNTITVSSLATPLLAPMIEEGFFNNNISRTIIHDYLSRKKLKGIDSLILGCTHYPLIRKEIEQYYKGNVEIFDTAQIVAERVKSILTKKQLLNNELPGRHRFFISDYTKAFEASTRIFFSGKIRLEQKDLWND